MLKTLATRRTLTVLMGALVAVSEIGRAHV